MKFVLFKDNAEAEVKIDDLSDILAIKRQIARTGSVFVEVRARTVRFSKDVSTDDEVITQTVASIKSSVSKILGIGNVYKYNVID